MCLPNRLPEWEPPSQRSNAVHGNTSRDALFPRLQCVPAESNGYVWPGWIPLGGITLLAGDLGIGKSLLVVHLAARLSVGGLNGKPARSLILTAEDSVSTMVVPRR